MTIQYAGQFDNALTWPEHNADRFDNPCPDCSPRWNAEGERIAALPWERLVHNLARRDIDDTDRERLKMHQDWYLLHGGDDGKPPVETFPANEEWLTAPLSRKDDVPWRYTYRGVDVDVVRPTWVEDRFRGWQLRGDVTITIGTRWRPVDGEEKFIVTMARSSPLDLADAGARGRWAHYACAPYTDPVADALEAVYQNIGALLSRPGEPEADVASTPLEAGIVELWPEDAETPPPPIVEGLLANGYIVMHGDDEGGGKSLVAEWLALSAANGKPIAGRMTTKTSVLLVDGQLGVARLRRRLEQMTLSYPVDEDPDTGLERDPVLPPLLYDARRHPLNILDPEGRDRLLRLYRRIARPGVPGLIILDPLHEFLGGADVDKAATIQEAFRVLRDLQSQFDPEPAIWCPLNFRKVATGPGTRAANRVSQRLFGSSRHSHLADLILGSRVDRVPGTRSISRIALFADKDRDAMFEPLDLELVQGDEERYSWLAFAAPSADKPAPGRTGGRPKKLDDAKEAIVDLLKDGAWHPWSGVVESLNGQYGETLLRNARAELEAEGRVELGERRVGLGLTIRGTSQ